MSRKRQNIMRMIYYEVGDDFKTNIDTFVERISDLKFIGSMFNNYVLKHLMENDLPIPEIEETMFTPIFNAVAGKKSIYSEQFDEFSKINKIGYYIPWISDCICY